MNFHYRITWANSQNTEKRTLKSYCSQNNFQEISFFLYKPFNNIAASSDSAQNVHKNPIGICSLKDCNFTQIKLCHGCFPVNFPKIFKTIFLQNTYGGLPLKLPVKKINWWSFYMIYDKQRNLYSYLFQQTMHNRTWRFRSCCIFMERVVDSSGGSTWLWE